MNILNNIKKISLLIVVFLFAGCGENFYTLTNKTLLDQMNTDMAYIQDNSEQVIKNLEEKQLTLPLTVDEKYQYVSSLLSYSGFDVRASLAMALGPNDGFIPSAPDNDSKKPGALDVMYSFINKDNFNLETIQELTVVYSKALLQCTGRTNNNLRIVCTLVGGASNTLAITKELLFVFAMPSLPADQNALDDILQEAARISGLDSSTFLLRQTQAIYNSMLIGDPDFESRLVRSANAIQAGLGTLEDLVGNSNGGNDNLLITMLEIVSDAILNTTSVGMNTVMAIIILDMFKL